MIVLTQGMISSLKTFLKDGRGEEISFRGNIMDSSIGTVFHLSVKESINYPLMILAKTG